MIIKWLSILKKNILICVTKILFIYVLHIEECLLSNIIMNDKCFNATWLRLIPSKSVFS